TRQELAMAGGSKKQRRTEQKKKKRRRQLERKREHGSVGGSSPSSWPAEPKKMSEGLEEVIEPYLPETDDIEHNPALYTLGAAAWNAALLPEDEQQDKVDEILQKIGPGPGDLRGLIHALIERKNARFKTDQRVIASFQVADLGDSYHLTVLWTLFVPGDR